MGGRARRVRRARAGAAAAAAAPARARLRGRRRGRRGRAEPARPGADRLGARGDRRRGGRAGALRAAGRRARARRPRRAASGSSQADGSKRLLGRYREASWSPFGRFVVAARANELAALDPARRAALVARAPAVRHPALGRHARRTRGSPTSAARTLRVVAGDGTGDRRLPRRRRVAPAWRPGARHVLAFASRDGRVHVVTRRLGRTLRRSRRAASARPAARLVGRRRPLLVVRAVGAGRRHLGPRSRATSSAGARRVAARRRLPAVDSTARRARLRLGASRSEVVGQRRSRSGVAREPLRGNGPLRRSSAWSPDGRWLLVAWEDADQWVIRAAGSRRSRPSPRGSSGAVPWRRGPRSVRRWALPARRLGFLGASCAPQALASRPRPEIAASGRAGTAL